MGTIRKIIPRKAWTQQDYGDCARMLAMTVGAIASKIGTDGARDLVREMLRDWRRIEAALSVGRALHFKFSRRGPMQRRGSDEQV